jgi:murein DD-endopeptidase MepM/ murein hydrolase activator NlpD
MLRISRIRRIRPPEDPSAAVKSERLQRLKYLLLGAVLVAVVPVVLNQWRRFHDRFLEQDPPVISLVGVPPGVGAEPRDLSFTVQDDGAGIDEVVVRISQKGNSQQLLRESFSGQRIDKHQFTVRLPGKEAGYRQGKVELDITAFDRSLWSNSGERKVMLNVDYSRPRIEAVSVMHNVELGGVEFAFYRLPGKAPPGHGVMWENTIFPGYQASAIDPAFSDNPDVYFAFFAVPIAFSSENDQLKLFARDEVGNIATSPFRYLVYPRKYGKRRVALSPDFMSGRVVELAREYRAASGINDAPEPPASAAEAAALFHQVHDEYGGTTEKMLGEILSKSEAKQLWSGKFVRPVGGRELASFGEEQTFEYEGEEIASARSNGMDLSAGRSAPVLAANSGIVVYAGPLGILGNTIVVDHGFGLSTVYAHLSTMKVERNDQLMGGAEIGRTGATGLADADMLHFEFRQAGVPVRSAEWFDERWINDHINRKIVMVKRTLGIPVPKTPKGEDHSAVRRKRKAG